MKKKYLAAGAVAGAAGATIAWKLLSRPKEVLWKEHARLVKHADKSHFVSVDGHRVHYQEFGDPNGPVLLLIHGFTASTYVWKSAAPILGDAGFRVIAVDLLGFGYSEKPAAFDYTITAQARMISRFMNRLGLGRASVVGSSYGGAVALTIALDYPERVEKLIVTDAVINDEAKEHPVMKMAAIPGVGEIITPLFLDSRAFMKVRMRNTLAPVNHHLITEDRISSILRPLSAADGHHSVLASGRNWSATRLERDAHLINQPTLIIWGDQDRVIRIENGYKLHNAILNSRFVILKNCGHVPQEEKSELFSELVAEFCRDKKGRIEEREGDEMQFEKAS
jgi:pimeloyl-ACP methyl ester carboxylesterase